jgi:hypothetical protein
MGDDKKDKPTNIAVFQLIKAAACVDFNRLMSMHASTGAPNAIGMQ